jgi:type III secretion system YscI/HrpB-like protein
MMRAHHEMDKAPDQLSLRDVLKLEYEFAVITLQIDVVGKGVQKAVQNIDTLVKMQ